jgi:hypothetical protein
MPTSEDGTHWVPAQVQARFYVRMIEKSASQRMEGWAQPVPLIVVHLAPVSGSRGEQNKTWASATPSGNISMTIGNPTAAKWFEDHLGQDIAIAFQERSKDEVPEEK